MARTITILHTPGCPNAALAGQRLAEALTRIAGPAPQVTVEEVADPDEAARRGFHGSPALPVDRVDAFAPSRSLPAFACRTYRTEAGVDGAPSVDQLVAAVLVRSLPDIYGLRVEQLAALPPTGDTYYRVRDQWVSPSPAAQAARTLYVNLPALTDGAS